MSLKLAPLQDRWVWIDLEMTGLDVEHCAIVQIAMVITNPALEELGAMDEVIWQPESALQAMVSVVREMHTRNGLIEQVRASKVSLAQAEQRAMALLCSHVPFGEGALAGASVWMDRIFLRRYMPRIEGYLHHRQIDVSSLKVLGQAWSGATGLPSLRPSAHTALADVRASINDLRFYRDRWQQGDVQD